MNVASPNSDRFRFFPQLNDLPEDQQSWLGSDSRLFECAAQTYFADDSLQSRLVREIAAVRLLPIKEVLESFEFFARVRKQTRAVCVADLCCGHGLIGVLFAMFEKRVERVILADREQPPSRLKLIEIANRIAPWVQPKVENVEAKLKAGGGTIPAGSAVVSAHACGVLSDLCIQIAIESGGPLAILPCCYPKSACKAPQSLVTALGLKMAFDVDRTYRLESAGYLVRWTSIPPVITPMNRIICARKKAAI
jgi:hypothetical protein